MRFLGWELARAAPLARKQTGASVNPGFISSVPGTGGSGWFRILESFAGAWQRNVEIGAAEVLTYGAVYACITLIASDIGKLRIKLLEELDPGVWDETTNSAYSPVLRKPNRYQTRIQFLEQWITSKLITGNTYILKERDARGVVRALYVLDPTRARPMIAPDGDVFYQVQADYLAGVEAAIHVPASEIIHDVMCPLWHPLCGVSPITACGLAAAQGLRVQVSSASFFGNGSQPGGILTAPIPIDEEEAERMSRRWQAKFTGDNAGKVAVLGGDLKYQPLAMSAVDAQLIDQLKWTAENVCTCFHVPPYMVGIGPAPSYNSVEALNQQYYSQCLQNPIESIELLLDEGLDVGEQLGTELDLDGLLRMDTASLVKAASESIGGGGMSPNEARRRWFGLGPVTGGESPYLQQQNYSLSALAKRDAAPDPFARTTSPVPAQDVVGGGTGGRAPGASAPSSGAPPPPGARDLASVLRLRAHARGLLRAEPATEVRP